MAALEVPYQVDRRRHLHRNPRWVEEPEAIIGDVSYYSTVPPDLKPLVGTTEARLRAGDSASELAHALMQACGGRPMDVYKILRASGVEYLPAKEAVSAASSSRS